MKRTVVLISLIGILTSCNKQIEESNLQPGDHTDDSITVTNINSTSPAASQAGTYSLLGYGYDVTGEYADTSATRHEVVDIAKLSNEQPARVVTLSIREAGPTVITAENAASYSRKLSSGVAATEGSKLFKGAILSYFPGTTLVLSNYIYGSYYYQIRNKRYSMNLPEDIKDYLTQAFQSDIKSKSAADIVKKYGTHILGDIIVGSKLVVLYQAETVNNDREKAAD